MNELSIGHQGYLAGLLDGEGNVGLSRSRSRNARTWKYSPCVGVTNTYVDVLSFCKRVTGLGHLSPKKVEKLNWKVSYEWSIRSYEQQDFLTAVLPFLIIKRRQAELMLEFLTSCMWPIGRGSPPEEIIVMRQVIFEEMAELNKRGC